MESFYGGRQGASVVIVKKFDGINLEIEPITGTGKLKGKILAHNSEGKLIESNGEYIEKTTANFTNPEYTWGWENLATFYKYISM